MMQPDAAIVTTAALYQASELETHWALLHLLLRSWYNPKLASLNLVTSEHCSATDGTWDSTGHSRQALAAATS